MIGKLLVGSIKVVGKFLSSSAGKKTIAAGTIIGFGLAGKGIHQGVSAKKKNKTAYAIKEEALVKHASKLNETNKNIAKLGYEEKKSIELIEYFMRLSEKINKCPSMNEIDLNIELPTISPIEIKEMRNGLELALAGVGGGFSGALPGLAFCGASLSTLGFAAIGSGLVLSIKGSKLAKQAVKNISQANKLMNEVEDIVEFYKKIDSASIKLKEAINIVNDGYKENLDILEKLIKKNSNYEKFSRNEKAHVKNLFKLTRLLANMCQTKLAKRKDEVELVNIVEIESIIDKADRVCKETRYGIFEKVFA